MSHAPGKFRTLREDLAQVKSYQVDLVVTLLSEEEMKMTPIDKSRCGWLLTWEELLSDQRLGAQDQHLGEKLSMQYLGMASYERSLKIMEYMMIARNFDHVSDDNIRIMARGHSKYGTGAFPSNVPCLLRQLALHLYNFP